MTRRGYLIRPLLDPDGNTITRAELEAAGRNDTGYGATRERPVAVDPALVGVVAGLQAGAS